MVYEVQVLIDDRKLTKTANKHTDLETQTVCKIPRIENGRTISYIEADRTDPCFCFEDGLLASQRLLLLEDINDAPVHKSYYIWCNLL